MPVIH
ncbi:hypothetical protein YPPY36_2556, partial [Yersinia pestis PY-36]